MMQHTKTDLPRPALELGPWLQERGAVEAFAALADLLPDAAVFVVDKDRRVLLWSRGAERLLGFPEGEVIGEHCLKSNRCRECIQACGVAARGLVEGVPLELFDARGERLRVKKHARAFLDDRGEFAGAIEVLVPEEHAPERSYLPLLPSETPLAFHGVLSRDERMHEVLDVVRNVAMSEATVLVRGESGTGKELIARAVHAESPRREGPFVAINCASMSPSLLESELFGHEKGSFTGAVRQHEGVFERAHGGTLFLDEVAELPLELQAKLLRVLEERTFYRVGGDRPISVNVRIVSATHRSLRDEVKKGRFREDLMFRLRVVPVFLPPLRERRGDVALLLDHFIAKLNARGGRQVRGVKPDAMRALLDHSWPGNVRELINVVEYAFAVGRGPEIALSQLPPEFRERGAPGGLPPAYAGVSEEEAVARALQETGGHVNEAAARLGMSRATFWRKRKKYGV